jgi:hypothetical protein
MNNLQSYAGSRQVSKLESGQVLCCGHGFRRRLMKCVITIIGLPVIIVATGLAHGDPEGGASADVNMSFLAALNAAGITYSDPGKAITAGQTMCDFVDQGKSGKQLVATLQKHNESLTTERARQFIAIALRAYCPELPPGS